MRWTKEAKRPSTTPTTVETQKLDFIGRFENTSKKSFFLGGKKIPVNIERERGLLWLSVNFKSKDFASKLKFPPYSRL